MSERNPSGEARRDPVQAGESLWRLRLGMLGTFAAITALTSLILTAVASYAGIAPLGLSGILGFVLVFHVGQWLIGPYLIGAVYRTKPIDPSGEYGWIHATIERMTTASALRRKPKLMLARIGIPNAFAYGSPLTGPMVAVTQGLVSSLPREEVEAVIAHEFGHLKHRDVLIMMMVSIFPALVYYLGYMLYMSGWFGGMNQRGQGGNSGFALLIGIALIAFSFILNIFVFYVSRLREYYADGHAARMSSNGAKNLQRALVRIMQAGGRLRRAEAATRASSRCSSLPTRTAKYEHSAMLTGSSKMSRRKNHDS